MVNAVTLAPVVDLNGSDPGDSTTVGYTESDPATPLAPNATVTDFDSLDFDGGTLTVTFSSGGTADDRLLVLNQGNGPGQFFVDEDTLYYEGNSIGAIGGGDYFNPLVASFNALVTPSIAAALIRSIGFVNYSLAAIGGSRTVTFTVADGDGHTSAPTTATVNVTAVDNPAVANDDAVITTESAVYEGSVFADNGSGPDADPDGTPIQVTSVNGNPASVGQTITLASGATLRLNANGTFTYNPNGKFNALADAASGAVNTSATDSFTYTITGGDGATVTVTINGEYSQNDTLMGDSSDNIIIGSDFNEFFNVSQGGDDNVSGLGGNDIFFFGATLTTDDVVSGGAGTDTLAIQGNYNIVLTGSITGIEAISLLSGTNTRFGDTANNRYDYNITVNNANFAGGQVKINGGNLVAGEDFTFNGAAETDARFLIYGGFGVENLTGGAQSDVFFFDGGTFQQGDKVVGGAGYDALFLRGNYTIDFNDAGWVNPFSGVENITVTSQSDTRYASTGGGPYNYSIKFADALLGAGETLTVNAGLLEANETLTFDGRLETNGNFRLFAGSGADTLIGGSGNDLIYGGGGKDVLIGNGGIDVFRFDATNESAAGNPDEIRQFESGIDKIDLTRIDANVFEPGDQPFRQATFNSFSGLGAPSAGELVIVAGPNAGEWEVRGDTNGDGAADFVILFTSTPLVTAADIMY